MNVHVLPDYAYSSPSAQVLRSVRLRMIHLTGCGHPFQVFRVAGQCCEPDNFRRTFQRLLSDVRECVCIQF